MMMKIEMVDKVKNLLDALSDLPREIGENIQVNITVKRKDIVTDFDNLVSLAIEEELKHFKLVDSKNLEETGMSPKTIKVIRYGNHLVLTIDVNGF